MNNCKTVITAIPIAKDTPDTADVAVVHNEHLGSWVASTLVADCLASWNELCLESCTPLGLGVKEVTAKRWIQSQCYLSRRVVTTGVLMLSALDGQHFRLSQNEPPETTPEQRTANTWHALRTMFLVHCEDAHEQALGLYTRIPTADGDPVWVQVSQHLARQIV